MADDSRSFVLSTKSSSLSPRFNILSIFSVITSLTSFTWPWSCVKLFVL
jgi:hypothetical protein